MRANGEPLQGQQLDDVELAACSSPFREFILVHKHFKPFCVDQFHDWLRQVKCHYLLKVLGFERSPEHSDWFCEPGYRGGYTWWDDKDVEHNGPYFPIGSSTWQACWIELGGACFVDWLRREWPAMKKYRCPDLMAYVNEVLAEQAKRQGGFKQPQKETDIDEYP